MQTFVVQLHGLLISTNKTSLLVHAMLVTTYTISLRRGSGGIMHFLTYFLFCYPQSTMHGVRIAQSAVLFESTKKEETLSSKISKSTVYT